MSADLNLVWAGEWSRDAALRAGSAMFPNGNIREIAGAMASCHPAALDYLRQAPILALAAAPGATGNRSRFSERMYVAGTFAEYCRRGDKLKTVMRGYGLTLPMRALKPFVLRPAHWNTIKRLASLPPSLLAQSIPQRPSDQLAWIKGLDEWCTRRWRAEADPFINFEWAASRLSTAGREAEQVAGDIADFAAAVRGRFDNRWTLDEARAAVERWHRELAARADTSAFFKKHGVSFTAPIDYDPLPDRAEIQGFEFVALRTGEDLFLEGRAMRHCVADYARHVISGRSRIYGLRLNEKRVATVELQDASGWRAVQIQGPCRATITKPAREAIAAFVDSLRERERTSMLASIGLAPGPLPSPRSPA